MSVVTVEKPFNFGPFTDDITNDTIRSTSSKFLTVRKSGEGVTVVDLSDFSYSKQPAVVESAVMNPSQKQLALQSEKTVQVFDLSKKEKVGSCTLSSKVVHVTWITDSLIGIITDSWVFHWVPTSEKPKKIFEREREARKTHNIISYQCDSTCTWLLLTVEHKDTHAREMQVYSTDRKTGRKIDGTCGRFINHKGATILVTANAEKIHAAEVPTAKAATTNYQTKAQNLTFKTEGDIPICLSAVGGVVSMITQNGELKMFGLSDLNQLHTTVITTGTKVISAVPNEGCGLLVFSTSGDVVKCSIDTMALVRVVEDQHGKGNPSALEVATAFGHFKEAKSAILQRVREHMNKADISAAVAEIISSPEECDLRTAETLQLFAGFPNGPGQPPPSMIYFNTIIEHHPPMKLNNIESLELAKTVLLKQGGVGMLDSLLKKNKISTSEELGDKLLTLDSDLALKIYTNCKCLSKTLNILIQKQQYVKALEIATATNFKDGETGNGYSPDWKSILQQCIVTDPTGAAIFASLLVGKITTTDPLEVAQLFTEKNHFRECTDFLTRILTKNDPSQSDIQTRLFELSLLHSPAQAVETLFTSGNGKGVKYTHFDPLKIGDLCEKAGLFQRALKLYCKAFLLSQRNEGGPEKEKEERRIMLGAQKCAVQSAESAPQWLPELIRLLPSKQGIELVGSLLVSNRHHSAVCAEALIANIEKVDLKLVIITFMDHKAYSSLYQLLSSSPISTSTDSDVHSTFIECAARIGQTIEVERQTRESDCYDPDTVLRTLIELRLTDPWPIINVCHKHHMWQPLVVHLSTTRNLRFLDLYLVEKHPEHTHHIVSALFDVGVDEEYVLSLLNKVDTSRVDVEQLVNEITSRGTNKVQIAIPWMEKQSESPNCNPIIITTLAKTYIDSCNPTKTRTFLAAHAGDYDTLEVGQYAEDKDPKTAFLAYQSGSFTEATDNRILALTENPANRGIELEKDLAGYLMKRQCPELWKKVLSIQEKDDLIKYLIESVIPKANNPSEVSVAVKAFLHAGMAAELLLVLKELIIVNKNPAFCENRYLQNLLLLTVIQNKPEEAMDYICKLTHFDVDEMAKIALKKNMYEEAIAIYQHETDGDAKAMTVVLENLKSEDRARQLAQKSTTKACWKIFGRYLLNKNDTQIPEALDWLKRAEDWSIISEAVRLSSTTESRNALVDYLYAARSTSTSGDMTFMQTADTELAHTLAKLERFTDLQELLATSHLANLTSAGDRLFEEKLFESARVLFAADHNYSKLASTLLQLKCYLEALDAAQKAGNTKTWTEVCFKCVDENELRLAQMAAQHLVIVPSELVACCDYFENRGFVSEVQSLLRSALQSEHTHAGIFTHLAKMLAHHNPDQLSEYLRLYHSKLSRTEILTVCEKLHLFKDVTFLHMTCEDYDSALRVLLDHPGSHGMWSSSVEETFLECCKRTTVLELIYGAVTLCLQEHPDVINKLLATVQSRVNPDRIVSVAQRFDSVPVIKDWLLQVQQVNSKGVNMALNELFIEEENYEDLKKSLSECGNYNPSEMSEKLIGHQLMEMRRVGSWLLSRTGHYQEAVNASLTDKLYKDATDFAAASENPQIVERLLRYYIENKLFECYAATLYSCFDHTQPDVALELAWRNQQHDLAMPYLIQVMKELWDSKCSCKSKCR
eukprot:TRINITY_DN9376_c0_g1_i1.p1 TRINITY_DN9376_c0_g1~~TRINITY_DN9376_c0_g1_i1.p1  ORF type:complete len:1664 (+),score=413.77 TRINITY_DN9376_c0_g1_i1:68-5059(+)